MRSRYQYISDNHGYHQFERSIQLIIRLHELIMLNIIRKHLSRDSTMTPRLEPNFLPELRREAMGPFAPGVLPSDILDSIRMDIFLVKAHIIYP